MATLHLEPVTDLGHPDLQPYRSLRRRKDMERQARFVVEGDKVVQRFLASPYRVESLLLTEEWLGRIRPLLDSRAESIRVFVAPKPQIEAVTGFGCFQGIKAVGRITHPATLEGVLDRGPRPRLLVAVDGISNAENLGVIVRNAAALGAHALLVGETSCSPFLTRAIRTSMGAVFRLPTVDVTSLTQALGELRRHKVRCFAAHPGAGLPTLEATDFRQDCCIVLGSEGYGLSPAVLAACDAPAAIPMAREVDSLNVSSSAAVFLYEAWRQRGFEPGPGSDECGSAKANAEP